MIPLSELFDINYGHSLELNSLNQVEREYGGIAFVSRKSGDNGISAYVERIPNTEPASAGLLTCALGGNGVMSTFIQEEPFYSGRDIAHLKAKTNMTKAVLLYYCYALLNNRYRFNYGRQANKTLKSLLVPSLDEIPEFVYETNISLFDRCSEPQNIVLFPELNTKNWKEFRYDEIFEIKNGYYNKKPPIAKKEHGIPFIGATEKHNGITSYISYEDLKKYSRDGSIDINEPIERKLFPAKCITVSNNGSVGEAFYQSIPFTCSHDVNPLYLKDKKIEITPYIGLFLSALIKADKYRWGYGRKWRPIRMPSSLIKLPITFEGLPDWNFMEEYIKGLPYSSSI